MLTITGFRDPTKSQQQAQLNNYILQYDHKFKEKVNMREAVVFCTSLIKNLNCCVQV